MPPCQNFGYCSAPDVCTCSEKFEGPQCQFDKNKFCLDKPSTPMNSQLVCNGTLECISTCNKGFAFATGSTELKLTCDSGSWVHCQQQTGKFQKVPDCLCNYIIVLLSFIKSRLNFWFRSFLSIVSHSRV